MVLASLPGPLVEPDDINAQTRKNIQQISFKSPSTSTTAFAAKRHYVSLKSFICNISISNCLIALKFDTEVKYLKLHKMLMTRLTPKLHS